MRRIDAKWKFREYLESSGSEFYYFFNNILLGLRNNGWIFRTTTHEPGKTQTDWTISRCEWNMSVPRLFGTAHACLANGWLATLFLSNTKCFYAKTVPHCIFHSKNRQTKLTIVLAGFVISKLALLFIGQNQLPLDRNLIRAEQRKICGLTPFTPRYFIEEG